jgi:hypothetical protein
MTKASYSVVEITDRRICLVDLNGQRSVTNDAEAVVSEVLHNCPNAANKKIVYRDSTGEWDELCHDGKEFTGFAPFYGTPPNV